MHAFETTSLTLLSTIDYTICKQHHYSSSLCSYYHHFLYTTTIDFMMAGSFKIVSKPGKKISLEHMSHPCPKCKHHASVQLIRSEKKWILFNKIIASAMRVRYECSRCKFRDEQLPHHSTEMNAIINEGRLVTYFEEGLINHKRMSALSDAVY